VKQRVRSAGARLAAPALAAVDRRLAALAVRLEAHTSNVAAEQGRRFDALDERVELDLRVVDEHLLAIERATRDIRAPAFASSPVLDGFTEPSLLLVVPPGAETVVPDGYEVVAREVHGDVVVLRLAPKS
jgi:hypothetical protein